MAALGFLHGDLDVHLRRAENLFNDETLGVPFFGKAVAKLARLKIDPYINFAIGGELCSSAMYMLDLQRRAQGSRYAGLLSRNACIASPLVLCSPLQRRYDA
jgi:hypothetical protein